MKNSLINFIIKSVGKQAFKKLFKGAENPMEQQHKFLMGLMKRNANTDYGQKYHFKDIHSISDYQSNVPVVEYSQLKDYNHTHTHLEGNGLIVGQPVHFSTTSGSTGQPKLIPISERGFKFEKLFTKASMYILQKQQPDVFSGKILQITSQAIEGYTQSEIEYGSATGQIGKNYPNMIKEKYVIHESTYAIEDFESRYYCILRQSIEQPLSLIVTENPSTLILLSHLLMKWEKELIEDIFRGTIQKKFQSVHTNGILQTLTPNPKLAHHIRSMIAQSEFKTLTPQIVWPDLNAIVCWTGGNCAHYLKQIPEYFGGHVSIQDPGYLAGEVRGAIPLTLNSPTGLPAFNHNFYEFVLIADINETNPIFYTLENVEQGQQYYIFITNESGLYRYNIHDIVEINDKYENVPMFEFIQKAKDITSLVGENLYEQQVRKIIESCAYSHNMELSFYIVYANQRRNGYDLYIQSENIHFENADILAKIIDDALQNENIEYKQNRKSSKLNPLKIVILKEGSFKIYKKFKVEFDCVRDTQFKMNYLTDNQADIASLHSNIKTNSEDMEEEYEQSI